MQSSLQDDRIVASVPLASGSGSGSGSGEDLDDLDVHGLVTGSSSSITPDLPAHHRVWLQLNYHFARNWRRIPSSWLLERDPVVALRHVITLIGFLSLCIFVFSLPSLLYAVSPAAPTPPGSAPDLDEAASTISGTNGAVAADVLQCSELGVHVLDRLAGNAIDAMVATVLCQGVLAPFASGIGGGALILLHYKRVPNAIGLSRLYDAREVAPAAATPSLFSENATTSRFGPMAVAVPGELRGLYRAHSDYGRLPWQQVVDPVVDLAEKAKVGKFLAIQLSQMSHTIMSSPSLKQLFTKKVPTEKTNAQQEAAASAELPGVRRPSKNLLHPTKPAFQHTSLATDATTEDQHAVSPAPLDDTTPPNDTYTIQVLEEGDDLKNLPLIATLKQIASNGPNAFYVNMSQTLAAEIRDEGGIITPKDIRDYTVRQRDVLVSSYQGFTILGAPVPSIGGINIAMALNMITELQFRKKGRNSISYQMLAECLKFVFGAAMGLGDPAFVPSAISQMKKMLSRREALRKAYRVDTSRTFRPERYSQSVSTSSLEGGTSHVSIVDRNGTAVSVTSSINLPFGAGLLSESTGVILNDQMDSFTTSRTRLNALGMYPTNENGVVGGKRPVTSMCPTIVMKGRSVFLVLGGSGGPKAISSVLQTLLNVLDFGDPLADAISAPRLHHQLVPNVLSLEAANATTCEESHALRRPSDDKASTSGWVYWGSVCQKLKEVGHKMEGPAVHGAVQAVLVPAGLSSTEDGEAQIFAASDPRRIGKAAAF